MDPFSTRTEGKYDDDDQTFSPTKSHCRISTPKFPCPLPILSLEGVLAVGRPDHLPSVIYRFLKPSRDRDLFITEL